MIKNKLNIIIFAIIICIVSTLSGCKTTPPNQTYTAYDVAEKLISNDIRNNIKVDNRSRSKPSVDIGKAMININRFGDDDNEHKVKTSRKFDLTVNEAPAKEFFMGLVKDTGHSMVVNPDVDGTISMSLKNVTVEDVLQTVERVYGFQYYATDNGFEILPNKLDTRIFSLNYLDMERTGSSSVQMTTSGISSGGGFGGFNNGLNNGFNNNNFNNGINNGFNNGFNNGRNNGFNNYSNSGGGTSSQVETKTIINFWGKLEDTLVAMLGEEDGRKIVVNPQSGVIVIRAFPRELRVVGEYLDQVQTHMSRQVMIEAKIVEVFLSDDYQLGIDWKLFEQSINTAQGIGGSASNAYTGLIKWVSDDFETNIKALSNQGTVQVLSSPRVSTVNNQKAVIKVGSDEFFVTNVGSGLINTANNTATTNGNVNLTPFFSGITLDVTPYVDEDNLVTLHVHPAVSSVDEQEKNFSLGASGSVSVPLAKSTVRETDTVVRAADGQVVVLGGLMQDRSEEVLAGLPYVGELPFVGKLFRNTKQASKKTELVILLKATVVNPSTWTKELKVAKKRLNRLDKGFHLGNRPDLYGTEAERMVENWPIDKPYIKKIFQ